MILYKGSLWFGVEKILHQERMKKLYKAIVLDIDGTLLNDDKEMTDKTKAALLEAQSNGIKLILASGRPTNGLIPLAKELMMDKNHGLLIAYNGSKVIDCSDNKVLYNQELTLDEVKSVLKHVAQFEGVTAMIDKDEHMFVTDMEGYMVEYETVGGGFIAQEEKDLANTIDFTTNKILTSAKPERLNEVAEALAKPFENELSCMFTAPFYFEYTPQEVDKGKTMHYLFKELGIKAEEIIAFGDAQNDQSMLEFAGTGVAMKNAVKEVISIADFVTDDNNNDGIAKALQHFKIIEG